jgi:hypothetical protein
LRPFKKEPNMNNATAATVRIPTLISLVNFIL